MTKFLIKHLVKNYNDVKNTVVRAAYGKLSGAVGIIINVLLFAGKMAVGLLSSSVAIVADAVNNLSDVSSGVISLIGFKLSERPADKEHPYGHGRYEYLAGLMVAVLIMAIGVELLKTGVERILRPKSVIPSAALIIILAVSILAKLWLMFFYRKIGGAIESKTLIASAADSRNDVITTSAVLASALVSHFTEVELDGCMAAAVAVFILVSGFSLVRETLDPMLGKAPDPEMVERIRRKIMSYSGVVGTHDLMVHDYGPGHQIASVHVEMPAEQDSVKSHEVIDRIERDIMSEEGLQMLVHLDPVSNSGAAAEMREWIEKKLARLDSRITVHDLRIGECENRKRVIFDCFMPSDMEMSETELKHWICGCIAGKYDSCECYITIDRSYAAAAK